MRPTFSSSEWSLGDDLFQGMALDGEVGSGGGPLVVNHFEGFFEVAGAHPHDNDAHPIVDLFYGQWLHLFARTVEVEVLDHSHDETRDRNRLSQGFFQFQRAHGGLIDDDRSGVGRLVGQGASLDHAQSHDFNEVAIRFIHA